MRTVNTVIANIERIIKLSNKKQENMIYQYWKVNLVFCNCHIKLWI